MGSYCKKQVAGKPGVGSKTQGIKP